MKFNVERMLPPALRKPGADVSELAPMSPDEMDRRFSCSATWGWSRKHRDDTNGAVAKKRDPKAAA
jgi:hypothetical protein